jgi:release factor glutamine methyltransferase
MAGPSYDEVVARLRAAGCVWAEDEATLLLESAAPRDLERLVSLRESGVPLEHVVGWAELAGVRVRVDPGVFVPRRRSELLVRTAISCAGGFERPVVVDLCCGSGAVGVAVVSALSVSTPPTAYELHAADVDPAAVACARRNVEPVGGVVYSGDLYGALPPGLVADVLVVNAPYVPSDEVDLLPRDARDHEPRLSLDGGSDGVDVQRRVAVGAPARLSTGGMLVVETSAEQEHLTVAAVVVAGLSARTVRDDDLRATVVVASRR